MIINNISYVIWDKRKNFISQGSSESTYFRWKKIPFRMYESARSPISPCGIHAAAVTSRTKFSRNVYRANKLTWMRKRDIEDGTEGKKEVSGRASARETPGEMGNWILLQSNFVQDSKNLHCFIPWGTSAAKYSNIDLDDLTDAKRILSSKELQRADSVHPDESTAAGQFNRNICINKLARSKRSVNWISCNGTMRWLLRKSPRKGSWSSGRCLID